MKVFNMFEDSNNQNETSSVVDVKQLKLFGLKRTIAYVPSEEVVKAAKKNNAERQARFRNKEKQLKETIKDIGIPPNDVLDYVKEHGWKKVGECIFLSKKYSDLPRFIKWVLRL
ncbi:MAG TPA: hypothetical protein VIO87_09295 [Methylotenera sp.]